MKKYRKEITMTVVLSVVFCFMLFLYEPVVMYLSNSLDFQFNLSMMIGPVLIGFSFFLVLFISLFFGLFFILKKKNKLEIYNYVLLGAFLVFFYCYIQGNFLAGFLPVLDGSPIDWNAVIPNVISVALLIVFAIIMVVLIRKNLVMKSLQISTWVTIAVFAMLVASFIPMLMNRGDDRVSLYPTTNNINNISSDKNFMILIVDAVDSRIFNERLSQSEEFKNIMNDFTYYPDTMSAYPFTRESMPMLLTGEWYESQEKFDVFSTNAYNNSRFLKELKEQNYDINLYSDSIVWQNVEDIEIDNWKPLDINIQPISFIKQEMKYVLFKYLPYPLKRFSRIENFDLGMKNNIAIGAEDAFTVSDTAFYNNLIDNMELNEQDGKMFSFIHIEGAHIPFDLDGNLNYVAEGGTYNDKIDATIRIVAKFLERLKENDAYDDSIIIIGADHGYNVTTAVPGRQNPILYIKGFDEHHSKMKIFERPVSEAEYIEAYSRLLDGESGGKAFGDSDYPEKRRYLEYLHTEVNHLIEYEQYGKAWDLTTMKPTGVEYNR